VKLILPRTLSGPSRLPVRSLFAPSPLFISHFLSLL
jgi:hypothetical protein